jgi:hypothetical protein
VLRGLDLEREKEETAEIRAGAQTRYCTEGTRLGPNSSEAHLRLESGRIGAKNTQSGGNDPERTDNRLGKHYSRKFVVSCPRQHSCNTLRSSVGIVPNEQKKNIVFCIRHQCRKTTVLSCHRGLINTGVEKVSNI